LPVGSETAEQGGHQLENPKNGPKKTPGQADANDQKRTGLLSPPWFKRMAEMGVQNSCGGQGEEKKKSGGQARVGQCESKNLKFCAPWRKGKKTGATKEKTRAPRGRLDDREPFPTNRRKKKVSKKGGVSRTNGCLSRAWNKMGRGGRGRKKTR